jgi:putative ABC transport system permease protein
MMARAPGFSAIVIVTLALGIGANTAVFSVVNSVLIRPLPYEEPERVVQVVQARHEQPDQPREDFMIDDFREWRGRITTTESIGAYRRTWFATTVDGEPIRTSAWMVSPALFRVLRMDPLLGRTFMPGEDEPGNEWVVVLSHGFWQQRLGADPDVLGSKLALDGIDHTVVGVMPPRSRLLDEEGDVWIPLTLYTRGQSPWADFRSARIIARLRDGATVEQMAAELDALNAAKIADYPAQYKDRFAGPFRPAPLQEQLVRGIRSQLLLLQGAVGLVLFVACMNLANLLLARSNSRQAELAIRSALGASRLRLLIQLFTESFILALIGGGAGLLLAFWGTQSFIALLPDSIPRLTQVSIDTEVLWFTLLLSLLTGTVFGLMPALRASSRSSAGGFWANRRSPIMIRRRRLRSVLVVAEVAVAMVLAIAAGLLVNSFLRILNVAPGFDPDHVLTLQLDLPRPRYTETSMHRRFYRQLLAAMQEVPEVEAVGIVNTLPLGNFSITGGFEIEGAASSTREDEYKMAQMHVVSPGYFDAMGIPVIRGRGFRDEVLRVGSEQVVINREFAQQYFPDQEPLGRRLITGDESPWEIIGIVEGTKHSGLTAATGPEIYMSYERFPQALERRGFISTIFLAIRSRTDPEALLPEIRSRILTIDPGLPVHNVLTMEDRVAESVSTQKFYAAFVGLFAILALILVCVGIYGVVSYYVTERTHEIGVRMALGARPGDISRLVVGRGLALSVLGVGLGLAGAWSLTRLLASLLYEVAPSDPATLVAMSCLLLTVALLALTQPAVRAARLDPMVSLRR